MESIYVFLIRNDVWIYILCGLGLIWYLSELIRARRLLRGAVFGLERERGRAILSNALTFILLFLAIIGGVAYVNLEIRPTLPAEALRPPSPTPNPFATPFGSPTPRGTERPTRPPPTPPLVPTVTLPSGAINPGSAATVVGRTPGPGPTTTAEDDTVELPPITDTPFSDPSGAGCTSIANITQPSNGAEVLGQVSFFGSAGGPDFSFYKLEINGPHTSGAWASVLDGVVGQPVTNGLLGQADLTNWQNGRYQVRLIVVDQTSNEIGPCLIEVELNNS